MAGDAMVADVAVPQPGQAVLVRNRPAAVREVMPYAGPGGVVHLIDVEYLDGWDFPTDDRLVWEQEWQRQLLTGTGLPRVDDLTVRADHPDRYAAFLDALRWTSIARVQGVTGDESPLVAPWHGAVALEPYQLYPVLKALEMPRVSLLLADDVGLGKTIEAGLVVSELLARRRARRILVVCPASLQLQWQEEMGSKFNLDFTVVDRGAVIEAQRTYGIDANVWVVTPRAITSMDYLRQPDVRGQFLAATRSFDRGHALPWDVLIVDEAHNLAPQGFTDRSQRSAMLSEIAPHFEHRLFLTATPHNGFTPSFTGLLEVLDPVRFRQANQLDEHRRAHLDLVMVRRVKSELNERARSRGESPPFADRDVLGWSFTWTREQQAVAAALRGYRRAGAELIRSLSRAERRAGRFVFSVLTKRLLSGSYAFARTWWKHVEGYESEPVELGELELARVRAESTTGDDREKTQREEDVVRQGASWLVRHGRQLVEHRERVSEALLTMGYDPWVVDEPLDPEAATMANRELPVDGKWDAVARWLDEHLIDDEERVILFTEYKDTLDELVVRLAASGRDMSQVRFVYGGSSLAEREQVKAAFNDPRDPVRILVATDVAAEGLNLQQTCRYVFHVEVPWNPARLEQRVGRVDRHGQARYVQAFHFTSEHDDDQEFLDYVVRKVDQMREDLGAISKVVDEAVEERFAHESIDIGELDARVEFAAKVTPQARDLLQSVGSDLEDRAGARTRALVETTETNLGLSGDRLARLLTVATELEGGRLSLAGADTWRFERVPAAWQRVVDDRVRISRGHQAGALPRLTFDPEVFIETVGDRRVFRSRADTVLVRLGHPLMQRAAAALRRRLWDPDGDLARFTIAEHPSLSQPVIVVAALAEAVNELREQLHAELLTHTLDPRDPASHPEPPTDDGRPLTDAALGGWRSWLASSWPRLRTQIERNLNGLHGELQDRLVEQLGEAQSVERERQHRLYDGRLDELRLERGPRYLERLRRDLAAAERSAAQLTFDEEENRERQARAARLEHQLEEEEEFRQLETQRERLRGRLERERERTLGEVLPRRYALARFTVTPVAVELAVPEGGQP